MLAASQLSYCMYNALQNGFLKFPLPHCNSMNSPSAQSSPVTSPLLPGFGNFFRPPVGITLPPGAPPFPPFMMPNDRQSFPPHSFPGPIHSEPSLTSVTQFHTPMKAERLDPSTTSSDLQSAEGGLPTQYPYAYGHRLSTTSQGTNGSDTAPDAGTSRGFSIMVGGDAGNQMDTRSNGGSDNEEDLLEQEIDPDRRFSVAGTSDADSVCGTSPRTGPGRIKRPKSREDKLCRVCSDRALGFNFGVLTCESCKAFFRRYAWNACHCHKNHITCTYISLGVILVEISYLERIKITLSLVIVFLIDSSVFFLQELHCEICFYVFK